MPSIAKLLQNLVPDPWRAKEGFSHDIEFFNRQILNDSKTDEEISGSLREWLADNQPCLFGRMASGPLDLLSFCILRNHDLEEGDTHIRDKIKRFRLLWKREAIHGLRSGFIILAASRRIIEAEPNEAMKELAKRLCFLYLREEIEEDKIHMDRLTLALPPTLEYPDESSFYEWFVGVNVFASAGDKRWWHDHRIPGGIAFSMNSVGHMARRAALLVFRSRNFSIRALSASERNIHQRTSIVSGCGNMERIGMELEH
jgi:predicted HTH domain antitoxin